jgi:hypothetical protein
MSLAASEHQDDQLLNAAITRANIKESFESYLEIVDAFYSDDVELILGEDIEPVRGRDDLRAHLANFLVPIHVMAELGGLSVSIRSTAIPATDGAGTHSRWEATLRASSGVTRAFGWSVQRRWKDSRVNYERHYDHQVDGPPISFEIFD